MLEVFADVELLEFIRAALTFVAHVHGGGGGP